MPPPSTVPSGITPSGTTPPGTAAPITVRRSTAPHEIDAEFRQFVSGRSASLLRTAFLLVGDWAHAEDVLQASLTKTYLAWRRLGQLEAVEAYARRVIVNTATSWWRRRWHGERPTAVMPDRVQPDLADQRAEREALWRHVRNLPVRQRAVLVLRFYEDLTEVETARVLGVSVGTVKSQCARALGTLRARLAAEGIEPAGTIGPPPSRGPHTHRPALARRQRPGSGDRPELERRA